MRISILTLFPEMFTGAFSESILKRAVESGALEICFYNIRDFAQNKHHQVDDYPFGGGAGMLMMPQPAFDCIQKAMDDGNGIATRIYFSPKGERLTMKLAAELSQKEELILLCGHYEGIDQRIIDHCIDLEISLGDYVLTGGEIPAMALVDCVARLLPGVLGSDVSAKDESFADGLLEYPQYTRPGDFRGMKVPEVLLSGNHAQIEKWKREQALIETKKRRPELLKTAALNEKERKQYTE
jgi:tRNA (guanine37-N1)-methyltransferase